MCRFPSSTAHSAQLETGLGLHWHMLQLPHCCCPPITDTEQDPCATPHTSSRGLLSPADSF